MKKHCKLTPAEKAKHDKATKIRKMTDEQIFTYIADQHHKAYELGLSFGEDRVHDFILALSCKSSTGNGIGPATVAKLREFAKNEGFISEGSENDG